VAKHFEKNKHHSIAVYLIPVIILFFVIMLYVQTARTEVIRAENAELRARVEKLETENAFYKRAYELTLDDIRVLSRAYGGEEKYEDLAEELRDKEIGIVLGEENRSTYLLSNAGLWQEYEKKGIIQLDCLGKASKVDTIADLVLFTFRVLGEGNGTVYIDGNKITSVANGTTVFEATLIEGVHEISILVGNGTLEITEILMDTVQVDTSITVYDRGASLLAFDCQEVDRLLFSDGAGAFRMLINKK